MGNIRVKLYKMSLVGLRFILEVLIEAALFCLFYVGLVIISSIVSVLIVNLLSLSGYFLNHIEDIKFSPEDYIRDFVFFFIFVATIIVRLPWQMLISWVWRYCLIGRGQSYLTSTFIPIAVPYVVCCTIFLTAMVQGEFWHFNGWPSAYFLLQMVLPSFLAAVLAPLATIRLTGKSLDDIWTGSAAAPADA